MNTGALGLLRPVLALTALDAAGGWLCLPTAERSAEAFRVDPAAIAGWPLDAIVVAVAAVGCVTVLAALTVVVLLALADLAVGNRSRLLHALVGRLTPQALRRLVMGLCGLGIAGSGLTAPAAVADGSTGAAHCPPRCAVKVDGLPLPELPTSPEAGPKPRNSLITVHAGDSLWQISASLLPPHTDPARVAALVNRLYATNRAVVGPDPDLIVPGMHLVAPKGQP